MRRTHLVRVVGVSSPFSLSPEILSSISSFTSASIMPFADLRGSGYVLKSALDASARRQRRRP